MGVTVNVLVTGASGYIGALVAARLQDHGHAVRAFARDPERVTLDVPVVIGDAVTGAGLERALDGAEVAYFLIHSMERGEESFAERELIAARRFADAVARSGTRRIIYLGGPAPSTGAPSDHLASRLAVERVLLAAVPEAVALRASIVIGARSRSFRFLVRLVERLPVLAIPGWGTNRTAPIDERDIVAMLVAAAERPAPAAGVFDASGPDLVTYHELIARIADMLLVRRPMVSLGRLTVTPIASRVAAVIAGESPELIAPLMDSLGTDLLGTGASAAASLDVRLHSLDAAIEHALSEWEQAEPLAAR